MIIPSVFPPHVQAAFTTREGGVSKPPFSSLNLGLSTTDSQASVLENRRVAAAVFELTPDRMAIAGQVHGSAVKWIEEPGLYPGFDGLVTKTPDLVLSISAADCASVLIADRASTLVGACHAGWRGHVGGIVDNTIGLMCEHGALPRDLVAFVSPCISVEHFEVGEEVVSHFLDNFVVRSPDWEKPHIDLSRSIETNLIRCGIHLENIERSIRCTFGEPEAFFSHRAQHGVTGRMMGLICSRSLSS